MSGMAGSYGNSIFNFGGAANLFAPRPLYLLIPFLLPTLTFYLVKS